MAKTELPLLGSNLATAMSVLASELAAKATPELDKAMDELAKHKEEWAGGRITVLFALRKNYGDDGMTKFPDPAVDTGEQPAKWRTKVKGTNGKDVTKTVDWYDLYTNSTPAGVRLQQEKQWLTRLADEHDNGKGIPADFAATYGDKADFAERKRADRMNWINGRLNTMKNSYRNAVALMYQMQRVLDLDGVNCDFLYTDDTETEVVSGDEKLIVWKIPADGKLVTHSRRFTLGSFMKLNTAKASESDNAYDALLESIKRDKSNDNTANDNSEARSQHIATTDTAYARTQDILDYYWNAVHGDDAKARLGEVRKAMRPGEGDGFFMAAYGLMETLKDILAGDINATRYEALIQQAEKAAA